MKSCRRLPQTTANYHKLPQITENHCKSLQTITNYHKLLRTALLLHFTAIFSYSMHRILLFAIQRTLCCNGSPCNFQKGSTRKAIDIATNESNTFGSTPKGLPLYKLQSLTKWSSWAEAEPPRQLQRKAVKFLKDVDCCVSGELGFLLEVSGKLSESNTQHFPSPQSTRIHLVSKFHDAHPEHSGIKGKKLCKCIRSLHSSF